MVGRSDLLRASGRVVFGPDCARGGLSSRLVFGARLWPSLYSGGRVSQEATIGGFCEPWARLLRVGAAGDKPMGIHKRGPHGGLRSCGCGEGGPGLGGVVRSLFSGFGLLLLEGVVKSATPTMMFNQGGCSFGHSLIRISQDSEGSLVDVARTDAVDGELDRLISRRASQDRRPDLDEQEALWKGSVRRYNARREGEMRAAWREHHQGQAARLRVFLEELIADHEQQAERYRDQTEGAACERPLQNGDEVRKLGSGERLSPRPALSRRRNGASPSSRSRGPLGRRRKRSGRR
jgi:hypothetical protein